MALNVLIVDDSDVIRQMIARTLDLARLPIGNVLQASNGREALAVLEEEWVDLVLADINMPVMNGMELVRRLHAKPETADLPVVIVSTEGANDRISELMDLGVIAWIRKPFTPEGIRDVVTGLLDTIPREAPDLGVIDDVFGRVMEQFAFVFPEAVDLASLPPHDGEVVYATLDFVGAASGEICVAAPMGLCVELAANVLGVEPDDDLARMRGADTLGEVLNMTGGHLATALEPDANTDLRPPAVRLLTADAWERMIDSDLTRGYLIEDHPVLLRATVRPSRLG